MGRNELKKSGLITAGLVIGIIGLVLSAVPIINNFAAILGGARYNFWYSWHCWR